MNNLNKIVEKVESIFPEIQSNRRHIHQNPELSFQEFETAKFIHEKLSEMGIDYKIHIETGTSAVIGSGKRCVALRADIDALPIGEQTDLDFASKTQSVMHACGHDMHTAMLLGAARILKDMENDIPGKIKLIFQPGEEKLPGGAKLMIEDGVLENPSPEAIFGQHVFPGASVGIVSTSAGAVMAAPDELYITIKGKSTHAAQPHSGNDPIVCAANLISYYQTIISRQKDPIKHAVISITSIHGGESTNIIPDEVKLMGTIRSFDADLRKDLHKLIREETVKLCSVYGCTVEVDLKVGYPAVMNDNEMAEITKNTVIELFGEDAFKTFQPKMWGEDFSFYGEKIPSCFWFTGVRSPELNSMPALHNSGMSPDEKAMIYGTSMLVAVALNYLKNA
jgi:amidohydrolase